MPGSVSSRHAHLLRQLAPYIPCQSQLLAGASGTGGWMGGRAIVDPSGNRRFAGGDSALSSSTDSTPGCHCCRWGEFTAQTQSHQNRDDDLPTQALIASTSFGIDLCLKAVAE